VHHAYSRDYIRSPWRWLLVGDDGMVRQWDSLTHDIVLPESSITPMSKVLREFIGRDDAQDLADMLAQVASAESDTDINQKEFLRAFREGFDLN